MLYVCVCVFVVCLPQWISCFTLLLCTNCWSYWSVIVNLSSFVVFIIIKNPNKNRICVNKMINKYRLIESSLWFLGSWKWSTGNPVWPRFLGSWRSSAVSTELRSPGGFGPRSRLIFNFNTGLNLTNNLYS